jgi:hypothetical protein
MASRKNSQRKYNTGAHEIQNIADLPSKPAILHNPPSNTALASGSAMHKHATTTVKMAFGAPPKARGASGAR